MSGRAEALPSSLPEGVRAALDIINPVENVACWRFGWRGWGLYPSCGPRHAIVEEEVYGAVPPVCRTITVRERRGPEVVVRRIRRCP
jgi:hypothetical protein